LTLGAVPVGYGDAGKRSCTAEPREMNITPASTKADIIDASMEIIETQAEQITALQERQLILWALIGIMSILLLAGAH